MSDKRNHYALNIPVNCDVPHDRKSRKRLLCSMSGVKVSEPRRIPESPRVLKPRNTMTLAKNQDNAAPKEPANPRAPGSARRQPAPRRVTPVVVAPRLPVPKFDGPVSPQYVLDNYRVYLTFLEEKEIEEYREIYYLRTKVPADKSLDPVTPRHFQFVTNEHIAFRFRMLKVLGRGQFGGIIKCFDHMTKKLVAVKLLRDHERHHAQIISEHGLLVMLQDDEGPKDYHMIRMTSAFEFRGFFCIVFELGYHDTYQILMRRKFQGFPLPMLQSIARQLLEGLWFIHWKQIIHCDLKPENILFMNRDLSKVKIIDLGCSCKLKDNMYDYIQSRFYRAPEVILGLDYDLRIDIWSFGCVLCELATGQPIFGGEDESEMMQMFTRVLGLPVDWMRKCGRRSHLYFGPDGKVVENPNSVGVVHVPGTSSLQKTTGIQDMYLLGLIEKCLKWEPQERPTADRLLQHPFFRQNYESGKSALDPPGRVRTGLIDYSRYVKSARA
jgi:dual specificity tyrosine-phosphorylation-regulated kinase 2/3/4